MFKTIATAVLGVGLALTATSSASAAVGKPAVARAGVVTQADLNSVHQWDIRSHVELVLHRSGTFVKAFDGAAPCPGCGTHYRVKRYTATTAGSYALVTYWRYTTPRDGDYGWVLWSKSWCDASGCVAQ